jgi:hypothetical protein
VTVQALRSTAHRSQLLAAEAVEPRVELDRLMAAGRAVAAGAARHRADQRRPGPGQLVVCRPAALRGRPQTRAYAARRRTEGKSTCDIRRCLKRAVARQLFKLLERHDRAEVELVRA